MSILPLGKAICKSNDRIKMIQKTKKLYEKSCHESLLVYNPVSTTLFSFESRYLLSDTCRSLPLSEKHAVEPNQPHKIH